MKDKLLTPAEAGEYLGGIRTNTLANWRWRGGGPFYRKIGGRVRYAVSDLDKFIEDGKRRTTSDLQRTR